MKGWWCFCIIGIDPKAFGKDWPIEKLRIRWGGENQWAVSKCVTETCIFTVCLFTRSISLALFRGEVQSDEYNCQFWKMREGASGISPPIQRFKEDFDPPAKYHISADVEYLVIYAMWYHPLCNSKFIEVLALRPANTIQMTRIVFCPIVTYNEI